MSTATTVDEIHHHHHQLSPHTDSDGGNDIAASAVAALEHYHDESHHVAAASTGDDNLAESAAAVQQNTDESILLPPVEEKQMEGEGGETSAVAMESLGNNAASTFRHAEEETAGDGDVSSDNNNSNGNKKRSSRDEDETAAALAKKKRLCRYPGCTKVIKSQGHCQRHGAKAKRCKVEGCEKQAQGTHDGMCKRHWKAANFPEESTKKGTTPPEPQGESVYDSILPMSIAYRPMQQQQKPSVDAGPASPAPVGNATTTAATTGENSAGTVNNGDDDEDANHDLLDPPTAPLGFQVMPLVAHLKEGVLAGKPAGWHRNAERRARGMFPVKGLSVQLEPWERQLALIEILLLSGGTPYANFKDLAYAWGREKGFHHVLANSVCERRGEVERKKRSDAGKSMSEEERLAFRSKLQKTRDKNGTSKKSNKNDPSNEGEEETDATTTGPDMGNANTEESESPSEKKHDEHNNQDIETTTTEPVMVDTEHSTMAADHQGQTQLDITESGGQQEPVAMGDVENMALV